MVFLFNYKITQYMCVCYTLAWTSAKFQCFQKQKFCSDKLPQVLWARRLPRCIGTWHKRQQDCMEGSHFMFRCSNNWLLL